MNRSLDRERAALLHVLQQRQQQRMTATPRERAIAKLTAKPEVHIVAGIGLAELYRGVVDRDPAALGRAGSLLATSGILDELDDAGDGTPCFAAGEVDDCPLRSTSSAANVGEASSPIDSSAELDRCIFCSQPLDAAHSRRLHMVCAFYSREKCMGPANVRPR